MKTYFCMININILHIGNIIFISNIVRKKLDTMKQLMTIKNGYVHLIILYTFFKHNQKLF